MVDHTDTLLTIAEVAAAFAGFGALATIFSRRSDASVGPQQFIRLSNIVGSAIFLVVAGFLPILILGFPAAEPFAWQLASGLILLLDWVYAAIAVRAARMISASTTSDSPTERVAVYGLEALIQVLLAMGALGFLGSLTAPVYLVCLALALVQIGVQFMVLVWRFSPHLR